VATAFIAKGYSNIMNYVQLLFSYFNAPLFATFIIAMFWRRTTPWAGFWGLLTGMVAAAASHNLASHGVIDLGTAQSQNFWQAIIAFLADAVVTVGVTLVTKPKPREELRGLVWGLKRQDVEDDSVAGDEAWYRSPYLLAAGAIILIVAGNIWLI
jgi:SSS family solute:Na+ symporter